VSPQIHERSDRFLKAAQHIHDVYEAEEQIEALRVEEEEKTNAIWEAGRDAALAEVIEFAKLSRHLVHPLFIPAVEGLKHTLHRTRR
jgi:hypothetical protein